VTLYSKDYEFLLSIQTIYNLTIMDSLFWDDFFGNRGNGRSEYGDLNRGANRDYFMVGERVRFLFTSGLLQVNE
jgi:hypothetical protein